MKNRKIICIVLGVLALCCGIAYLTCYLLIPQQTIDFSMGVKEFFTQPLPIIGVSLVFIGVLLAKLFAKTSFGKKQLEKTWDLIGAVKEDFNVQKVKLEEEIVVLKEQLELAKKECEKVKEYADKIAKTIPNKKVNNLVEEYGKESKND